MNPVVDATDPNVAYAFAAANGGCGKCYELKFDGDQKDKTQGQTTGFSLKPGVNASLIPKKMFIQVVNSGADGEYTDSHFDIMMGGGGQGYNDACASQFPTTTDWGEVWGGFGESDSTKCDTLPPGQSDGCKWRYAWANGWRNPSMSYRRVKCPTQLTSLSGIDNVTGM
jgi:hypothetical protein